LCLIFHVFQFSCFIPGPTVCIFHFPRFSVFFFHIPGPRVWDSHFPNFLVFSQKSTSYSVHFSLSMFFRVFFLPYSRYYSLHVSFFMFFSFSHHILGHTVFVSHFPYFSGFSP
jgi:hypothetical protein